MHMQAQKGGGGTFPTQLNPSNRRSWEVNTTLWPLHPLERPSIHCLRRLVGPWGRSGRHGKSRLRWDSISGPPSQYRVAMATELSWQALTREGYICFVSSNMCKCRSQRSPTDCDASLCVI